ncbi:hypothetical protein CDD82_2109 [Ophiocordyceps australis]|uniref:SWI5-dependent HO expression protein 3 n=1 Tax=Ophiocordyceps australis TaxID=1399860 RepID=A0A2C5ZKF6_9HYPO|nr:hypothetical protein CDD82_2109 [Ophiocordyceps australis]
MPWKRLHKADFSIHRDVHAPSSPQADSSHLDALPVKTLTAASTAPKSLAPASTRILNSMPARAIAASKAPLPRNATIRSVSSLDGSDSSPGRSSSPNSASCSSAAPHPAMGSSQHDSSPPPVRLKPAETVPRSVSGPNTASAAPTAPTAAISAASSRWAVNGVRTLDPSQDPAPASDPQDADAGQWDSTIGKAGLGKTGRVINKLVSDNDALKRDIQIERLRADEAKQAAKLIEDKMERMASEYEGRLLEATVTKTLLARKERQVETLSAAVEAERAKATAALDREGSWRRELDRVRSDASTRVDEASGYAQLIEGRYNVVASHWRNRGDEVRRALSRIRSDIDALVDQRHADDDRIRTLRDLCDQQDSNIRLLRRQRDDMAHLFDNYKRTQEDDLRHIRSQARAREEEQERLLTEAREALAKLRWALNVKTNVKDAQ